MNKVSQSKEHPCLSCGACCAFFRVSFQRQETKPGGPWQVPLDFVEDTHSDRRPKEDSDLVSMKGTTQKHRASCVALKGIIGRRAYCGIYTQRPTPCRAFMASYENGQRNPRCDEARLRHGLPPLIKDDYKEQAS